MNELIPNQTKGQNVKKSYQNKQSLTFLPCHPRASNKIPNDSKHFKENVKKGMFFNILIFCYEESLNDRNYLNDNRWLYISLSVAPA